MATERQLQYISDLLESKDITGGYMTIDQIEFLSRDDVLDRIATLTDNSRISNIIKNLQACPKSVAYHVITPETPNPGYFFIVDPTDHVEKFFRVNYDQEKKKARLSVQASDFFYPIKSHTHRDAVYAEIQKDPINAMNEYGMRLERCGVCNRTLTDRDSRLRGIGPICAERLYGGQAAPDDLDLLAKIGLVKAQQAESTDFGKPEALAELKIRQLERKEMEAEVEQRSNKQEQDRPHQHEHNVDEDYKPTPKQQNDFFDGGDSVGDDFFNKEW